MWLNTLTNRPIGTLLCFFSSRRQHTKLQGDWSSDVCSSDLYAYAWALANIEYIVQADGMGDVERILDRIGAGMATETALRDVLHSGYDDLMQSAAEYQIGRGSCRERVEISVGAVSLK